MLYLGELFAIGTVISWSIGIFPLTQASERVGANALNHVRLLLAFVVISILLLVLRGSFLERLLLVEQTQWFYLILSGVISLSIGDYFRFSSFALLGPTVASLFITLAPAAALFFGYFLLGESVNWVGGLGMGITIIGIVWFNLSKKSSSHSSEPPENKRKGVIHALIGTVSLGLGLVLAKRGMMNSSTDELLPSLDATWIRIGGATVAVYLTSLFTKRLRKVHVPILKNENNGLKYVLAGALCGPIIGIPFSMEAAALTEVSVVQTILSLVPVFVLIWGALFFKQKIQFKMILAAFLAVSGVVLLIWRNSLFA